MSKLAVKSVDVGKLFAGRRKLDETIVDVREGRLSHSSSQPLVVSQLDTPRGGFMIVDGHHRAVEAVLDGRRTVRIVIDTYIPWIERTGGAHSGIVNNKVNVAGYVKGDR